MSKLKFISDEDLINSVNFLLDKAFKARKKTEKSFGKNIIDPFGAMFEMAGFEADMPTWIQNEKTRQAQKTLQNQLGAFHQKIIGSISDWKDLGTGKIVDLANEPRQIVAEVKNKYNTVKGSDQKSVYDTLYDAIMPKQTLYHGYTSYYVEIIPKAPERYNIPFTPSDNKTGIKRALNEKIRRIDGYSFYELATGIPDALDQLFLALPDAIETCMPNKKISQDDRAFAQNFFNNAYKKK